MNVTQIYSNEVHELKIQCENPINVFIQAEAELYGKGNKF